MSPQLHRLVLLPALLITTAGASAAAYRGYVELPWTPTVCQQESHFLTDPCTGEPQWLLDDRGAINMDPYLCKYVAVDGPDVGDHLSGDRAPVGSRVAAPVSHSVHGALDERGYTFAPELEPRHLRCLPRRHSRRSSGTDAWRVADRSGTRGLPGRRHPTGKLVVRVRAGRSGIPAARDGLFLSGARFRASRRRHDLRTFERRTGGDSIIRGLPTLRRAGPARDEVASPTGFEPVLPP